MLACGNRGTPMGLGAGGDLLRLVLIMLAVAPARAVAQDTLVVRIDEAPRWGSTPTLVEEVRIGSLAGQGPSAFGGIGGAAVSPTGLVAVVDPLGPHVQLFDSAGAFLRTIGTPGPGPGEYQSVAGVAFTPSGELAIWDPRSRRLSWFTPNGAFATSVGMPSSLQSTDEIFRVDTLGRAYVKAAGSARGGVISSYLWIRHDPGTGAFDTLRIPDARTHGRPLNIVRTSGVLRPFHVETVSALSPLGYQVRGRNDAYILLRPLADGRLLKMEREVEPVPVARAERHQWERLLDGIAGRFPSATEFAPIPDTKPVFRSFWIDQTGRIWVRRYVDAELRPPGPGNAPPPALSRLDWVERPVWDVLGERGLNFGTLTLPFRTAPLAAYGRTLWVHTLGPLDESYLVKYRIHPGG